MNVAALLEPITELAFRAGEAVMRVYDDPHALAATIKADGSAVTEADQAAEALIEAGLAALAPEVPRIAEEAAAAGRAPAGAARMFLVDPLDGTREFVARNGEFTVNIALVEDGAPVLGIVVAPALKRAWRAAEGRAEVCDVGGAWRPIRVRPRPPEGADVLVSRSRVDAAVDRWLQQQAVRRRVPMGSSLKFCRIAEGAADLYPRFGPTCAWDTAAGQAVLEGAGGTVLTLAGARLSYDALDPAKGYRNESFVASGG